MEYTTGHEEQHHHHEMSIPADDTEEQFIQTVSTDGRVAHHRLAPKEEPQQQEEYHDEANDNNNNGQTVVQVNDSYKKLVVLGGFSFLSGWADTLAVIHFQTFAAMMTGNIVFLGITVAPTVDQTIAGVTQPWWYYLIVILSNVMGSTIVNYVRMLPSKQKYKSPDIASSHGEDKDFLHVRREGMIVGSVCLVLMLTGSILFQQTSSRYSLLCFAITFGAQNVFTSGSTKLGSIGTTVMTSNTQKLGTLMAMMLILLNDDNCEDDDKHQSHKRPKVTRPRPKQLFNVFASLSTLAGALVGGGLMHISGSSPVSEFIIACPQFICFVLHDIWL